jgi:hypothetical protein
LGGAARCKRHSPVTTAISAYYSRPPQQDEWPQSYDPQPLKPWPSSDPYYTEGAANADALAAAKLARPDRAGIESARANEADREAGLQLIANMLPAHSIFAGAEHLAGLTSAASHAAILPLAVGWRRMFGPAAEEAWLDELNPTVRSHLPWQVGESGAQEFGPKSPQSALGMDVTYPDPAPATYEGNIAPDTTVWDHNTARALGGHPTDLNNLDPRAWAENARKAGFEGQYRLDLDLYMKGGLTEDQAKWVLEPELNAIKNDIHASPVDPKILDRLPSP